jgi:hypothetical protein
LNLPEVQRGAPVIGADGVAVGTVDRLVGRRLKIARKGAFTGRKHYVDVGLIAEVEDGAVRLSANADVVMLLEDDED